MQMKEAIKKPKNSDKPVTEIAKTFRVAISASLRRMNALARLETPKKLKDHKRKSRNKTLSLVKKNSFAISNPAEETLEEAGTQWSTIMRRLHEWKHNQVQTTGYTQEV